jgi:outer membrane receptor protein involved in Fe transport
MTHVALRKIDPSPATAQNCHKLLKEGFMMIFDKNAATFAKNHHRQSSTVAMLLASTLLTASPAFAQESAPADEGDSTEIIVTATKRSESLQNVPISIQAFNTEKLAQNQVAAFDDYAKLLPSVSFQSFGPGQSQIFFRGVTSGGDGLRTGSLPTSSLYVDEIPLTTIAGSVDLHIYDIARIEALSGPQGTLFGASSLSGTLRVITNKPDPSKFAAGYDLQANKFKDGDEGGVIEGFLNLPISDRAAVRIVGFYKRDGGYIDNVAATRTYLLGDTDPTTNLTVNNAALVEKDFNDVETYGGRIALGIDLDDNWTVTPALIYQRQKTKGPFLFDPRVGDLQVTDFLPTNNKDRFYQAALTIEGKIGNWDITYAGGYFGRKVDNAQDYSYYTVAYDQLLGSYYTNFVGANGNFIDPTQTQLLRDRYTKLSNELRLNSPADKRLRVTFGGFQQRQRDNVSADYIIAGLGGATNGPFIVPGTVDNIFLTRAKRVDRDYAVFGEASFDITKKLIVTAGIRGFKVKNTLFGFSGFRSNALAPICLPTTQTDRPCNNFDRVQKETGETRKLNLTYKIDSEKLVYVTYSTGFRPGGNNRRPGILPYDADTLDNYEFGFKTTLLDRRLRFNGALFYEEFNDLQFGLSPVGSAGVTNIYNAGDARIYGAEADFSFRIIDGLTLSGAGTYIDAKLTTDFCQVDAIGNVVCVPGVAPAAPKGTRLPVQPKFKGNLIARYEFDAGKQRSFIQGGINYQGGTRSQLTDREQAVIGPTKSFTTFDFSAGTKFGDFSVEAFIQNAFDKRGILTINTVCVPSICGGGARSFPIKPQIFGIKVGQKF